MLKNNDVTYLIPTIARSYHRKPFIAKEIDVARREYPAHVRRMAKAIEKINENPEYLLSAVAAKYEVNEKLLVKIWNGGVKNR